MHGLQAPGNAGLGPDLILQAATRLKDLKTAFEAQLNHLLPTTSTLPSYDFTHFQTTVQTDFISSFADLQSKGKDCQALSCVV